MERELFLKVCEVVLGDQFSVFPQDEPRVRLVVSCSGEVGQILVDLFEQAHGVGDLIVAEVLEALEQQPLVQLKDAFDLECVHLLDLLRQLHTPAACLLSVLLISHRLHRLAGKLLHVAVRSLVERLRVREVGVWTGLWDHHLTWVRLVSVLRL